MRVLITGVTGFVGGHLARALLARGGVAVCGWSRHARWPAGTADLAEAVRVRAVDLGDPAALRAALKDDKPDQIYHLAGYADVARSFQEADAAWAGNLTATRHLYDAVAAWGGKPRILYVGSGAVYGEPRDPDRPLDEHCELRPNNPYATSKAAADLLSYQYHRGQGLDVVRARPFNHVGPGQSDRFALAHFAWQIAAGERGPAAPVLHVGNIWTERDYTDVRDVVRAYLLLMDHGKAGEAYNIGSGQTRTMQAFLNHLLALSKVQVRVEADPNLTRRVETPTVRVDAGLLRQATGWVPAYALEQTLADTLEYCREHVTPRGERGA